MTTPSTPEQCSFSGVEFSGRSCAGINEVNFKGMAESVSPYHKQLTFDSAFCQVELLDSKIIEVIGASPGEKSISTTLGEVRLSPCASLVWSFSMNKRYRFHLKTILHMFAIYWL